MPFKPLEMAQKIDGMERSVDSYEANFLDTVLPILRAGRDLSDGQFRFLLKTFRKYFDADGEPLSSPSRDDD